jgi:hypothetical protein
MTEKKLKDLLDKIRKLKAKADDAGTTEEESLAFAAKVAEMLAAYGLEEAQLATEEQDGVSHEEFMTNWNTSPYRRKLTAAICSLYMVQPLVSKNRKTWTLIGRRHNVIMVKEMTEYLIKTTTRLSNKYGKDNSDANVIDFRRGCYTRLAERIMEMYYEQSRAAATYSSQGNPSNLPALYKNELELARSYMAKHWGKVGTMRGGARARLGADAIAGRAAGDSISLNKQVGSSSTYLLGRK